MIISYLTLVIALAISVVSEYFSIQGLTALFVGSYWPVVVMASSLAAGKLVAISWLYRHWAISSLFIRTYLLLAIITLSLITSMGCYGYLSKAHIDLSFSNSVSNTEQLALVQNKIDGAKGQVVNLQKQIDQIDSALDNLIKNNRAATSLAQQQAQKKNRDALVLQQDTLNKTISTLTDQKIHYETESRKAEADVGPLKYVAQLLFVQASSDDIDKTIRYLILIIVSVFDPLAIILLIAANVGIKNSSKKQLTLPHKDDILKLDASVLEQKIGK
jgi:hypothetical protein